MCCLLLCKTSWFHFPPLLSAYHFPSIHPENSFVSSRGRDHATNTLSNKIHIKWDSLSISDTTSHLPKMSSQRKKGRSCIWGAMRAQLKRKGLARPCITNASLVSLIFLNARRRESSGDRCFNARCADDCDLACAWVFFCSFCPWPSRALSSLLLQVHQREKKWVESVMTFNRRRCG